MNPKKRHFILFLEDMITSMGRIAEYIGNSDFDGFSNNMMVVDAVVRNFEIIGEAAKNIPVEIREEYPQIPWIKMYGLRNLVSHVYFGIDHEMIWEIIKNELPKNKIDLKVIIEIETDKNDS